MSAHLFASPVVFTCQVLVVCICSYVDVSAFKDRNSPGEEDGVVKLALLHVISTVCSLLQS